MCGIVGGIAQRNVVPILLEGLRRLEYRGYDSAGIAIHDGKDLRRIRSLERVATLSDLSKATNLQGTLGIGHTRWATHGDPSERNAHPHFSHDQIAVVHNGIIENHAALRESLKAQGYVFASETDTEVIVHLIHQHYQHSQDLLAAVQATVKKLKGAYAIAVMAHDNPNVLIGARHGSPLLLGLGIEENFIGSDASALLPVTQRFVYLEEGDVVKLECQQWQVFDTQDQAVERAVHVSDLSADVVELGTYRHFMQKEIFEQPRALMDTIGLVNSVGLSPALFGTHAEDVFHKIQSVTILACGTSYHAGLVARYWLEEYAGLPTQVEIASEYRYRTSVANPQALVVTISQSGETADTLAALKHAQQLGHTATLAICNVPESALVRQSALRFITRAGAEIGVASTKAFTTQLAALLLLTLTLSQMRGRLSANAQAQALAALNHLPIAVQSVLSLEPQMRQWGEQLAEKHNALFIGRGVHFPIALEGALKLKEISYIHAEAYAAGELKHGPLALIDRDMPVIALVPPDDLLDKVKSNLEEIRARKGSLYVLTHAEAGMSASDQVSVVTLPVSDPWLSPVLYTVPLQLLAYYTALNKGTDVDKPRNLAKSVTVE